MISLLMVIHPMDVHVAHGWFTNMLFFFKPQTKVRAIRHCGSMDTYTDLGLTENMLYLQIEWCSIIFNIKVGLDGIYPISDTPMYFWVCTWPLRLKDVTCKWAISTTFVSVPSRLVYICLYMI